MSRCTGVDCGLCASTRVWEMLPSQTNVTSFFSRKVRQDSASRLTFRPNWVMIRTPAIAEDDVGVVGVAISSLEDMEQLFEGIPIDKVSTHLNINATAPIIFAMYLAMAEKRGFDVSQLRGTLQNDILKEFLARKAFIFPPDSLSGLSATSLSIRSSTRRNSTRFQ